MKPLAYHITWGTYGTRLHGDPRGTVERAHNEYRTPVLGRDPERLAEMNANLKFPPRKFTREQMVFVERTAPEVCRRGGWIHHASAAGPDHVHIVLASPHDPAVIRRLLKRWLGEELSNTWPIPSDATWWSEGGSIRWIGDIGYLNAATDYVRRQQATGRG
jgi:hypothetical protein